VAPLQLVRLHMVRQHMVRLHMGWAIIFFVLSGKILIAQGLAPRDRTVRRQNIDSRGLRAKIL
jgi:hypothetical protein